jgi:DNA-directed RNA polymerase subunit RPC12/RpoP
MSSEIAYCPLCAGKLEEEDGDQYRCLECESEFLIQVVDELDEEDEDEDEKDDRDEDGDEDEDEEEEDDDEY